VSDEDESQPTWERYHELEVEIARLRIKRSRVSAGRWTTINQEIIKLTKQRHTIGEQLCATRSLT
jgi:hypothetical protein